MNGQRFLRRAEVEARTGLPRSTIYQMISDGQFPKPVRLTPRIVGWIEAEIDAWSAAKVEERDHARAS